jgi:hypothetical protein
MPRISSAQEAFGFLRIDRLATKLSGERFQGSHGKHGPDHRRRGAWTETGIQMPMNLRGKANQRRTQRAQQEVASTGPIQIPTALRTAPESKRSS